MADHPFAAKYRAATEAFNAGDFSALDEMITDDIEWWEVGASAPLRGKAALHASLGEGTDYEITATLHDVLANDEHVIALIEAEATRNGQSLQYRTVEIHHVDEEGRITQRWSFADDTQAVTEFFS